MEIPTQNTDGNEPKKRPLLLNILLVLSAATILSSIFGVTKSLLQGPLSEDQLEERFQPIYESMAEINNADFDQEVVDNINHLMELTVENYTFFNNQKFYSNLWLQFFTLVIGGIGVFYMYKMKKVGFHFYMAYSLLPAILIYLSTPKGLILSYEIMWIVLSASVMGLLYGLNLKQME